MASWGEAGHIYTQSGGLLSVPTSALTFDTAQELLWSGTANGNVESHYGPALQRYTSWLAHSPALSNTLPQDPVVQGVKGILTDERAVYSVGEGGIKSALRSGLGRWNLFASKTEFPSLNLSSLCFSPTASSDIITGGASSTASATGQLGKDDVIVSLNSGTGGIIRKEPAEAQLSQIRRSAKYICAGSIDGHIQLRDPRTLRIQQRVHAHPGGLIDMQAEGNQLYSVGWTMRLGHPVPEPIVKVHDLRTMRPLVPIPFSSQGGPALLAVHPKRSSTVIVAAPSGQFQIVDVNNLGEATFHQVNLSSYLTSMAMSPSADFLAFGEADGSVHLLASSNDASNFSSFSTKSIDLPDSPDTPAVVNWTTETALSKIGMPYYDEALLSSLPYDQYCTDASPLFNPPPKLDRAVLNNLRIVDNVAYSTVPKSLKGKRNYIHGAGPGGMSAGSAARAQDRKRPEDRRRIGAPLFRSEKEAAKRHANGKEEMDESMEVVEAEGDMPSYYQVKTIQYSKFGVEDFDFEYYNKTPYSGLETHIENSYANGYLQALHYLLPFRQIAKSHMLQSAPIDPTEGGCVRDDCLLCQAGFLSKMLEDAKGANCQATNFLRALGSSQKAASLGLMDKEGSPSADVAYSNLIQIFNRFMLSTVAMESFEASKPQSFNTTVQPSKEAELMSKLFTVAYETKHSCTTCGHTVARDANSRTVDLIYPRKVLSNEVPPPSDFASVLKASLLRETLTKASCRACHAPAAIIRSRRTLSSNECLPQALSINCSVLSAEQLRHWLLGTQGASYVPPHISIRQQDDNLDIREIREHSQLEQERGEGSTIYTLRSIVAQVQADKDVPHLIALVKIQDADKDKNSEESWYLFNDFLVRPVSQEEALSFPGAWKVPAVLMWERIDHDMDISALPTEADPRLLGFDLCIAQKRDERLKRHTPLQPAELPIKKGTVVAIDSEFVALNQEELELSSTGSRRLIRPSRLSLARVSVVRGQGDREGEAFVDDFIWTQDDVTDYLTQFSGIQRESSDASVFLC